MTTRLPAQLAMAWMVFFARPALAQDPGSLDGAQVFRNNCGRCHQPRTPGDLSASGWRAVSFHMRVRANLTRREFWALEAFLVPEPDQPEQTDATSAVPDVVRSACSTCHDLERIETAVIDGRSASEWATTIERMRSYGAPISRDAADELVDALVPPTSED